MIENGKENKCVFEKINSGWLCGMSITNSSAIQILLVGKQDEYGAKYFFKTKKHPKGDAN